MAEHNDLGKWGEQLIVDRLLMDGYTIMERNFRVGHLEIDIIASRDEDIVFVEVKTRRNSYENPLDAMTPTKIAQLCRAAESYIRSRNIELIPRFDVAAVIGDGHDETAEVEYIPNAFQPPLRTY